ncbi:hypothetical protein GGS23DRAFT_558730 [Durotheca rogersii]|uniref:uncharacterized protein n=1 Tax=Durotheca rogersii TaxID=419775 RepID=UPI002220C110|nr:uncharacterized protein GGS23DRAFT_558730 [Durotheca rogersii]KAI5865327.1 hypothetical protein GGS23DRAFT_558730 [Durotheca rogersii]
MKCLAQSLFLVAVGLVPAAKGELQWSSLDRPGQSVLQSASMVERCRGACATLREKYGDQLLLPDEVAYEEELSKYWSLQQSQTRPSCIFFPNDRDEASSALLISRQAECPFAAKSGGHAAFAGSSNIAGGITINLANLNEITINRDRNTVTIGAGNKWVNVYRRLEEENLIVIGGRVAPIGVGGLTLGGGISYFSNTYGWACDNVASYEIVTASGIVVVATPDANQDLYWALRGGGNNLGLVTKFELFSYPLDHSAMWFGKMMHPAAQNASLLQAFVDYGRRGAAEDLKSTILFSFVYLQSQDQYVVVTEVEYPEKVADGTHPAVYDAFFDVPDALRVTSETKKLVDIAQEHSDANPNGLRQSYWTATVKLDLALLHEILAIWYAELEPIKGKIAGFVPVITFQVVTMSMLERMKLNGGNALGLQDEEVPLVSIVPSAMWTDAKDDAAIRTAYSNWVEKTTAKAKSRGLDHPYLYMNYASEYQDPVEGYGKENSKRLREVAKKYDPEGFFQTLQPGYFKV